MEANAQQRAKWVERWKDSGLTAMDLRGEPAAREWTRIAEYLDSTIKAHEQSSTLRSLVRDVHLRSLRRSRSGNILVGPTLGLAAMVRTSIVLTLAFSIVVCGPGREAATSSIEGRKMTSTPQDRYASNEPYKIVIVSGDVYLKLVSSPAPPFGPFRRVSPTEFRHSKKSTQSVYLQQGTWLYTDDEVSMSAQRVDASELSLLEDSEQ